MLMMKKLLLGLLLILLVSNGALAQNTWRDTVFFDYDKYNINQIEQEKLNVFVKKIKALKVNSAKIVGHTDHDGSDEYNIILSKRRVNAVLNYLVSKDVEQNIITSDYSGEKAPIADNSTESGKHKNRRVDILIKYEEEEDDEVQSFKLHPYLENEVKGNKGTVITIPRDAMVLKLTNKVPCRTVNMDLTERYGEPDVNYFKYAIDTTGVELLANGTIRYSALCAKGELKIISGQKIKLELYTEYEGAEIFIGKYTKDGIKWFRQNNSYVYIPDFGQVLFYMVAPGK